MHLPTVVRIYESSDPPAALRAMAESLTPDIPLRSTFWVAADKQVQASWPEDVNPSPELLDLALHTLRPEVFPLGSEFPADSEQFPDCEMLLLPLGQSGESTGVAVLVAGEGAFGEDLQPWMGMATALERVMQQHQRHNLIANECNTLRQRVEEAEALHTLGLAVNRTLDPEEVLALVARFTRTLLGAHYITVNTLDDGQVMAVASVGLRTRETATKDYFLASKVVQAGKPLVVGGPESTYQVEDFPFHKEEGMQVGLGIPLSLFGETFGALVIGYRREYTPTPRDTRLALTLAGHAAVAISNARLHHTLADRSAELEEAYSELRRTSELKERFFASMSHELRTPLNGILGYQNLLLEDLAGSFDPGARVYLEKSNRAALNLLGLVNDILDYAKIEAGKVVLQIRPATMVEIVEDAVANVEPIAVQKGVQLTTPQPDSAVSIHTDPDRVRQILINLLSNAIKFTPKGGEISIEATNHVANGISEFRVRDSGPGIALEDQESIFREFEQVKGTKGGTGLGLPISRKLAELLGGELWVESADGAGSTFVLRLPLERNIIAAATT
jgi:signal transduction histidine kinase